jgi:hypothetical protein
MKGIVLASLLSLGLVGSALAGPPKVAGPIGALAPVMIQCPATVSLSMSDVSAPWKTPPTVGENLKSARVATDTSAAGTKAYLLCDYGVLGLTPAVKVPPGACHVTPDQRGFVCTSGTTFK